MNLAAAHDHAVLAALDNVQVLVGIPLLGGAGHTVALRIGLGTGADKVVLLEVLQELQETLIVGRAVLGINVFDDGGQGVHHIDAHAALDTAAAHAADLTGHLLLLQQILGTLVDVGKAVDGLAGDVRRRGHQIVHLGVIDETEGHADGGARLHNTGIIAANALAVEIDIVTHALQFFQILLLRSHFSSSLIRTRGQVVFPS